MLQNNSADALLTAATVTGAGDSVRLPNGVKTFQASLAGSGSVSATVLIQVSNDGSQWLTLGTITLSGTSSASDGFVSDETWYSHRANVSAISGTSAAVTVTVS